MPLLAMFNCLLLVAFVLVVWSSEGRHQTQQGFQSIADWVGLGKEVLAL